MVPETYANYFLGSTGASAALLGLLFVAISLAPERIFGPGATAARRAQARGAFLALLNVFFVSLVALIPKTNLGYTAFVMGVLGLGFTVGVGRNLWEARREEQWWSRLALFVAGLVIYGWELWYAVGLLRDPRAVGNIEGLAYLALAAYGLGVGRAWELMTERAEVAAE
jgi:hypothetical protein